MKWLETIRVLLQFGAEGLALIRAARSGGDKRSVDEILAEERLKNVLRKADEQAARMWSRDDS